MSRPWTYLPSTPTGPLVVDRPFYDRLARETATRTLVDRFVVPIRSGRAWPVRAGQLCRIVTLDGDTTPALVISIVAVSEVDPPPPPVPPPPEGAVGESLPPPQAIAAARIAAAAIPHTHCVLSSLIGYASLHRDTGIA